MIAQKHSSGKPRKTGTRTVKRPTAARRSTYSTTVTLEMLNLTHKIQQSAQSLSRNLKGIIEDTLRQ